MHDSTNPDLPAPTRGWPAAALAAWCAAAAVVMMWGAVLSTLHALASPIGWIPGVLAAAGAALFCAHAMRPSDSLWAALQGTRKAIRTQPALLILGGGVAATLVAGVLTAFCAAPSNWDCMTYQLARVAYYLQQGSLADYGANFFSQEQQARGTSIVQCAIIVLSGRSDLLVGLPQLLGYLMCLGSVYLLALRIGRSCAAAFAAAASFGLLTIVAMEAPTPQNDLILASFIGAGLVGTLAYIPRGVTAGLWLAAGGFALSLAVKASALTCVPAVLIVIATLVWRTPKPRAAAARRAAILVAVTALAMLVLAWPAGYWKNIRRFGNPIGGPQMFEHHTEMGGTAQSRLQLGTVNLVRFGADLYTLDGLPESWGGHSGSAVKRMVGSAVEWLGLDAESPVATNSPFAWARPRFADENLSYFGWIGAVLLIPGCLGALFLIRRQPLVFVFALSFFVFLACQTFAGRYDPWRGRHFIYGAIFAAPAAAWLFDARSRAVRRATWIAAVVGAIAIVPAMLRRSPNPLLSHPGARSLFDLDRLQQMSIQHPSYRALAAFDRIVPPDATVIVALGGNEYEYVLFGRRLGRHLIPFPQAKKHPERAGRANYLLYDRWARMPPQPGDIDLGYHWWLRRLDVVHSR